MPAIDACGHQQRQGQYTACGLTRIRPGLMADIDQAVAGRLHPTRRLPLAEQAARQPSHSAEHNTHH